MTFSSESPLSQRRSCWSDLRRRYFQKRYLVSWILVALLPFILLQLLFMSEITFPFFQTASSSTSLQLEGNVSQGQSPINFASSPAPGPDVNPKTTPESPPFIRPDEDAWSTHDDWINHNLNPPVDKRKEDHKAFHNENENSTEFMKSFPSKTDNRDKFGSPEDNEKEELELEATQTDERNIHKDTTAEAETSTKEKDEPEVVGGSETNAESSQQVKSEDEGKIKTEEEKPSHFKEGNSQKEKAEDEEEIKNEKEKQLEASAGNAQEELPEKEKKTKDEEEKQLEANSGNAQQEKSEEKEGKQTEDSRNSGGLGRADEQSEPEERHPSEEDKAEQSRVAEAKRNFKGAKPETNSPQEKEAVVTQNVGQEDRSTIDEHSDVAPETNFEEEQKRGADEHAKPEQKAATEQKPSKPKIKGEKRHKPDATKQKPPKPKIQGEKKRRKSEKMKPLEEQHEPEEQVDKAGDKLQQESGRKDEVTPAGDCDLFEGEWEHDPEGPLYTNSTCFYIQEAQNCMSNGRPDTEYMYWKWRPRGCDLPRFDAKSFLGSLMGKAIGFVGDSIARNQMQSLLCLLSQVEIPIMTYESADDKTVRWLYKEHQVTLAVVWSPYLLKEGNKGVMGFENGQSVLYLDVLDTAWTSVMQDFDIMILLTGQWYYKGSVYVQQGKVVGCHYCPGLNLTEIEFYQAYEAGIRQVLEKVSSEFKGVAIMSTFPLSHFENGTWDTGGYCKREQPLQPLQSKQFPGDHNKFHEIAVKEFNDVVRENRAMNKDARLEILDVTKVSLQRADGHPGPFRRHHPEEGRDPNVYYPNDCLHWCLPGPIEAWNQLVVKIVEKYL